ncbi:MAG: phosphoribosylamine--glycine ligase [bacterium]|nr:phosphoribosylamine--glycine ligase [bacterium]
MGVLLIGSGGREHALAYAFSRNQMASDIFCTPGNGGIAELATCLDLDVNDHMSVVDFCRNNSVELVVVGPELPLVDGLVDSLEAQGIKAFGPTKAAAQLEGSKAFTKQLCSKYNIPTADYEVFDEADVAYCYLNDCSYPVVIKADGLAAGKGVVIAHDHAQAQQAVQDCFDGRFGDAGTSIVIEEYLVGEEASFFAICDGESAMELPTAQDHKCAFDGDVGPNTGGMGAYSPAPVMSYEMRQRTMDEIIMPTLKGMKADGIPFKGVLFAGLMITSDGPKLIEYNVRFGDPECQVLIARLRSDLLPVMLASSDGKLDRMVNQFDDRPAITIVMASKGYPGAYESGSEIKGLEEAAKDPDIMIFHAGTKNEDGRILATGGRVLNITALGKTVSKARDKAYAAIEKIDWPQGFYRKDIGWRAVEREKETT